MNRGSSRKSLSFPEMSDARYRIEQDALGEINVPANKYFGAQTQRARINYPIGGDRERIPKPLITAMGIIKKAAADVNTEYGLSRRIGDAITKACNEVISGQLYDSGNFPLVIWQSGSGTHTNTNVNEVISNRAIEILGGQLGSKDPVHPIDHVNMGQSAHDVFPTAIHISVGLELNNNLLPAIIDLRTALRSKEKLIQDIVKIGRTHLMDTAPMTMGQEFSGYVQQISNSIKRLECCLPWVYELALGGMAVGNGLNSNLTFAEKCIVKIRELTNLPFHSAPNFYEAIACRDAIIDVHGVLNTIAVSLMKIANDIQLMSSGPRCGLGELLLQETEQGRTILPGKVNPTPCEMLTMICAQVMGNQTALSIGGSNGHFELNCFQPLIASNVLQSITLIADGCRSFTRTCVVGLKANIRRIEKMVDNSLVMAISLTPHLGYDTAAQIAIAASKNGTTLKEEAIKAGVLSEEDFMRIINPKEAAKSKIQFTLP